MTYIRPVHDPGVRRKLNQWDREYLAKFVLEGERGKVVVNDEVLKDDTILITVTKKAWEEMGKLG